jgi:hypothetical protein
MGIKSSVVRALALMLEISPLRGQIDWDNVRVRRCTLRAVRAVRGRFADI